MVMQCGRQAAIYIVILNIEYYSQSVAGWQSGYAAACKAVDAGSIPTPASKYY